MMALSHCDFETNIPENYKEATESDDEWKNGINEESMSLEKMKPAK